MSHYDTPASMSQPDPASRPGWRSIFTNALRYWEPRRLIYNAVLAAVVLVHWLDARSASEVNYTSGHWIWLFLLAVGANLCYCAAYGVDIFLQLSDFRRLWLQWRWVLFGIGILTAAAAAHLISGPFFRQPA